MSSLLEVEKTVRKYRITAGHRRVAVVEDSMQDSRPVAADTGSMDAAVVGTAQKVGILPGGTGGTTCHEPVVTCSTGSTVIVAVPVGFVGLFVAVFVGSEAMSQCHGIVVFGRSSYWLTVHGH